MSKTLVSILTAMLLGLIVTADLGCATSFTGSAQYPGGPAACFRNCQGQRMRMAQYVYVGSYSSACVCEIIPPGERAAAGATGGSSGGTSAAAVAVMTAMRERERQSRR